MFCAFISACCEHECKPVKLLFILDSSESVGLHNFALEKQFIIHVINKITKFGNKNERGSRVGIVQYSHEGTQELVSMDDPTITTLSELKSAVKNMRWIAGGTYTGEALDFARKAFGDALLSRKVAIVLTDGRSDTRDTKPLSSLCNIPNIKVRLLTVYGLSIWCIMGIFHYCISDEYTSRIPDYSQLLEESFFNNVTSYMCQEFKGPADIVFMLDGSLTVGPNNFKNSRDFVANMASRLLSSNAAGLRRVSVMQYSDSRSRVEVPFTSNMNDAVTKLNEVSFLGGSSDLPAALNFLNRAVQKEWRANVLRKVVTFTDGRSAFATGNLPRAARVLQDEGIEVFALTVGDTFDETGICQLVSGKESGFDYKFVESHVHQVVQYSDLTKWSVMQKLARQLSKASISGLGLI
uniref:VWFA domain-containing protein n=1 Tax=Astyanax mexicanus TaxID=7994 RepID=A0A8B9K533_ASTMX